MNDHTGSMRVRPASSRNTTTLAATSRKTPRQTESSSSSCEIAPNSNARPPANSNAPPTDLTAQTTTVPARTDQRSRAEQPNVCPISQSRPSVAWVCGFGKVSRVILLLENVPTGSVVIVQAPQPQGWGGALLLYGRWVPQRITAVVSPARLQPYRDHWTAQSGGVAGSEAAIAALYLWQVGMSAAWYEVLAFTEMAVRHSLDTELRKWNAAQPGCGPDWYVSQRHRSAESWGGRARSNGSPTRPAKPAISGRSTTRTSVYIPPAVVTRWFMTIWSRS